MTYIVAEPCIRTKDHACVDVCPVECFYLGPDMLYIHPEECIDCGACIPECPVAAIFEESDVPEQWKDYIAKNAEPFKNGGTMPKAPTREKWEEDKKVRRAMQPSTTWRIRPRLSRPLKTAHLRRCSAWAITAAYLEYALTHLRWVPRPSRTALHLGPF